MTAVKHVELILTSQLVEEKLDMWKVGHQKIWHKL